MGRSVSNLAAVILLAAVAASAAALLSIWLVHLIWGLHAPASVSEALEVTSASVTTGEGGTVIEVEVYDPYGSPATSLVALQLVALNGTVLCTAQGLSTNGQGGQSAGGPASVTPGQAVTLQGECPGLTLKEGLQARVVVVTASGFEASKGVTVG